MLISCWSAKGGSGTTVVASALALVLARRHEAGALLVDLCGDVPAVLGVDDRGAAGVADWLSAGDSVPADSLARLEQHEGERLALLVRGSGELRSGARAEVLASVLGADRRHVVVDCGRLDGGVAHVMAASATHSLLVTRPCYVSLRRAVASPIKPSAIVMVKEDQRVLEAPDLEHIIGAPVVAEVAVDPSIARAVDAGVFRHRLPRALERALRHAA